MKESTLEFENKMPKTLTLRCHIILPCNPFRHQVFTRSLHKDIYEKYLRLKQAIKYHTKTLLDIFWRSRNGGGGNLHSLLAETVNLANH